MMRIMTFAILSGAMMLGTAAPAGAEPGSGTITMRATATFSDGTSADRLYRVSPADLDGDGWLRVVCADGAATAAYYYHEVKSPRDAASGQASGKRMHKPFTIIKEWGAKSGGGKGSGADDGVVEGGDGTSGNDGVIGARASWDLATGKGARSATYDVKKVEGTGAKTGGTKTGGTKTGYNVKSVEGTGARVGKTMAMDDWHQVMLIEGTPNLCN